MFLSAIKAKGLQNRKMAEGGKENIQEELFRHKSR